jgi:hypothetical protein
MRDDLTRLAKEVRQALKKEKAQAEPSQEAIDALEQVRDDLELASDDTAVVEVSGGNVQETYGPYPVIVVDWDNLTGGR